MCGDDIVSDTAWHKIQSLQSNKNENFKSSFLSEQKKKNNNWQDLKKHIPNNTRIEKKKRRNIFYDTFTYPRVLRILLCLLFILSTSIDYVKWKSSDFQLNRKSFILKYWIFIDSLRENNNNKIFRIAN